MIKPIFLWLLFGLICIIAIQFWFKKEYPMALIWSGSALTEAGFLWYVYSGGE